MTRPLRVRGARSGPGDVPPAGGGSGQLGPGPAFSQAVAMWRMRRKRRDGLEQREGLWHCSAGSSGEMLTAAGSAGKTDFIFPETVFKTSQRV